MRRLPIYCLVSLSIVLLSGYVCDSESVSDNSLVTSNNSCCAKVKFTRTPFSKAMPTLPDQVIQDIQLIDDKHALLLAKHIEFKTGYYLQILGPEGVRPFISNAELSAYGQPIAISQIVDSRVVIAVEKLDDDQNTHSIKLAIVDLITMRVIDLFDFVDNDSEPKFDNQGKSLPLDYVSGAMTYYWSRSEYSRLYGVVNLNLVNSQMLLISAYAKGSRKSFWVDLKSKKISKTLLIPHVQNAWYMPPGAALFGVQGTGKFVFAVADLVAAESQVLEKIHGEKLVSKSLRGAGQFVFAIDQDGKVASVTKLSLPDKVTNGYASEIIVHDDQIVIGGGGYVEGNYQKPFVVKLNYEATTRSFKQDWLRTLALCHGKSTVLSSLSFSGNNEILAGGSTGFIQASTGSILEPDDAFFALLSENGDVLGVDIFGAKLCDRVALMKHISSEKVLVLSEEDFEITHGPKSDSSFSGVYELSVFRDD